MNLVYGLLYIYFDIKEIGMFDLLVEATREKVG